MTICNLYSFSYLDQHKLSWLEFFDNVRAQIKQWPYDRMASVLSDLTEDEYESTWHNLLYPTSYISSMDIQQTLELLLSQSLIVDCSISGSYDIVCSNITYFTWDPIYQGCYTIHVPEHMAQVVFGLIKREKPKAVVIDL